MLAVAALTAVGFFADRLNQGLARDAGALLGGDAVVGSDKPAPPELTQRATALGLQTASSASFPSMGRAPDELGGASRLVAVKAVSDAYPLRGQLRLKAAPDAAERSVAGAPARGTVWVDAALLDALAAAGGRRPAARRHGAGDRADHRHRARPRRRLHELCAARHAQPGRPGRHRADPAGQPRQLPAGGGRAARPRGRAARLRGLGRSSRSRPCRCAACASSRCRAAGPRCARRWTAPRSSSTWWRCWRRCWPRWRWASPRATSRSATSTTARCSACSACRRRASPAPTRWSSPASARWPARPACCSASSCTTSSSGCWPGW